MTARNNCDRNSAAGFQGYIGNTKLAVDDLQVDFFSAASQREVMTCAGK